MMEVIATEEKATKNVVRKTLFVTLTLVAALIACVVFLCLNIRVVVLFWYCFST